MTNEILMTTKEVMDYLGLKSRPALYRYIKSGRLKAIQITFYPGKPYQFRKEDIEAFRQSMLKENDYASHL